MRPAVPLPPAVRAAWRRVASKYGLASMSAGSSGEHGAAGCVVGLAVDGERHPPLQQDEHLLLAVVGVRWRTGIGHPGDPRALSCAR